MNNIYRTGFSLLIIFLLLISTEKLFAQFPGMDKVYSNIAKQNAQRQTALMVNQMLNWRQYADYGDLYNVTLKDSSKHNITSLISLDSVAHKYFLVFVNKKFPKSDTIHRYQKIYPDQTLFITTDDPELAEKIIGIPTDSCWSFRIVSGPLCVYAKNAHYLTANRKDFDKAIIIGIQLNNGPIEELTDENLRKMIEKNPKALDLLNKNELYKAIKKYNRDAEKAAEK